MKISAAEILTLIMKLNELIEHLNSTAWDDSDISKWVMPPLYQAKGQLSLLYKIRK